MQSNVRAHPPIESRWLYQAAMLVFVITVSIGILNGLKLVTFDRAQLLTHVHAGTLGWITLAVLATCLWLFGTTGSPARSLVRPLAWVAALGVPVYVAAFWSGNLPARAIFGWPVLLAIAGFYLWVIQQLRVSRLTIPRLAVFLALTSLIIGSTIGVLFQVQLATEQKFLPDAIIGGHVSAQVVGYLVLIAMAITEWRLKPDSATLSRLAIAQVSLPFLGALIAIIGASLGSNEALGAFIPFEVVGVAIFVWRFAPEVKRATWLAGGPERHFAVMVPFLVADLALLITLIYGVISGTYADFTLIPVWLFFAFDHAMFVGVMSNGLFGLIQEVTRERRALVPWADHVLFWGMNLGMIGFVLSLLTNQRDLERFFAPIMGGSILIAIVAYSLRLQTRAAAPLGAPSPAQ